MSAVLSSTENYISSFDIDIFYCQIAVFQAGLKNPFNDWTETHVQQGFSWRAESVSFGTLDESGKAAVYITIPKNLILKPNTIRAIKVPFTVPQNGLVEIGSVTETQTVEIDSGTYELLFETGFKQEGLMWCQFSFCRSDHPTAMVLRADDQLNVPEHLLLSAGPAV